MIFRRAGLAAALAAVGLVAAPACGQASLDDLSEAQQDEIYCVYDGIGVSGEAYYDIADGYLAGMGEADVLETLADTLEPFVGECVKKYAWSAERKELATAIGVVGTAADVLSEDLLDLGLNETELDAVYDAIGAMSDDDIDTLYAGSWAGNSDMQTRAQALLSEAGFPDDPVLLPDALTLMELNVVALFATQSWVEAFIG
jgi:hypothetical protein